MLTFNILALVFLITGTCGEIGQHIVGGEDAGDDEYPLTIRLLLDSELICGGLLAGLKWAITSAHCVVDRPKEQLTVKWNFEKSSFDFTLHTIDIYPEFQNFDDYSIHDIALLGLNEIALAQSYLSTLNMIAWLFPEDVNATVVGWGRLSEDGPYAEKLQKVELPLLSHEECQEIHGDRYNVEINVCAGFTDPEVKKDVCIGDFGNVLYFNETNAIGLASWEDKPCHVGPKYVAVFTTFTAYVDWFDEHGIISLEAH